MNLISVKNTTDYLTHSIPKSWAWISGLELADVLQLSFFLVVPA